MASHGSRFVLIVRHGERSDDVGAPKNAEPQGDPSLTENGKAKIGELVAELTESTPGGLQTLSQMKVFSSPFLRCRQTAEGLTSRGVGLAQATESTGPSGIIDDDLSEVYGPIRIKTKEAPAPWQQDSVGLRPMWPETMEDARDRFRAALVKHLEEEPEDHICLVTHGDALDAVYTWLFPGRILYEASYLSFLLLEVPKLPPLSPDIPPQTGPLFVQVAKEHGIMWMEGDEGGDQGDSRVPQPIILGESAASKKKRKGKSAVFTTVDSVRNEALSRGGAAPAQSLPHHTAVTIPPPATGLRRTASNNHEAAVAGGGVNTSSPGPTYGQMDSQLGSTGNGAKHHTRNYFASNYGCRVVGVLSSLLMLATDPVPPVVLLTASVSVLELLTLFVRPLYELCPTSPTSPTVLSETDGEHDSLLDTPRRSNAVNVFQKIPGVAGIVKLLTALAIYLICSFALMKPGDMWILPGHLVTTAPGYIFIFIYLACDAARVWKKV